MRRGWLCLLLMLSPLAAWAQPASDAPGCDSIDACISILREHRIEPAPPPGSEWPFDGDERPAATATQLLVSYGDPAVPEILKLLQHPNLYVRVRAVEALSRFRKLRPEHLPALVAADRAGVWWLEDDIARVGTDAAMAYLWEKLEGDFGDWSSSLVTDALQRFGPRLTPLLEAGLARCRTSSDRRLCNNVFSLAEQVKPSPAFTVAMIEAVARSPDASEGVRTLAEDRLIHAEHPYGVTILTARLARMLDDLGPPRADAGTVRAPGLSGLPIDWDLEFIAWDIGDYGAQAVSAGPLLTQLLSRRDAPDGRAQAALAIGQIGYREGAEALLKQAGDFDHDWQLAYNAVESLGLLRIEAARTTLQHVKDTHWRPAVRNNAERALNMLDGGAFERPGVAGDVAEPAEIVIGAAWKAYRYQGDRDAPIPSCTVTAERAYGQFFVVPMAWPGPADGAVALSPNMPPLALPVFAGAPFVSGETGELMFVVRNGDDLLVGTNAGEFGGVVLDVRRGQRREVLIDDNAIAAFVVDQKVMIITGLSHMITNRGALWIVDLASGKPVIEHRVRLPFEPTGFAMAHPETLVIRSEQGDVGVRADGTIVDIRSIAGCRGPEGG